MPVEMISFTLVIYNNILHDHIDSIEDHLPLDGQTQAFEYGLCFQYIIDHYVMDP